MPEYDAERRRSPRFGLPNHTISVDASLRVRVVDIGSGGVLIACDRALTHGTFAFHVSLGGSRFSATVRVRHSRVLPDSAVQFGAAFEELSSESRQSLERFLGRAAH